MAENENTKISIEDEDSSKPLAEDLFQHLQKDILTGELPPDTKITEKSVCDKYSVSRTPVREAFRQLEADGLIRTVPNRGAYVIGLTVRDISDMFDMRRIFEVQAIEWAIERMSDDDIDKLRENMEFMEFYTLKNDIEKVLTFNMNFHNIIYKSTQNRMMCQTLSTYHVYLKHSAPVKTFSEDFLKTILKEHQAIFEAVENRNIPAAKKAMDYHMHQSKLRRMTKYF